MRLTDEPLEKLEKRIRKAYTEAEQEVENNFTVAKAKRFRLHQTKEGGEKPHWYF